MTTQVLTPDYVAKSLAILTPEQLRSVYEFAQFLAMHGDTLIESAADEATWDKAFAETDTAKLQSWLDVVDAEEPLEELVVKSDAQGDWIEFLAVKE